MDSHSRGNKRLPKGFLAQGEPQRQKRKPFLQSNLVSTLGKTKVSGKVVKSAGSFIIARAYRDTNGSELIEQLLLQRDFIID